MSELSGEKHSQAIEAAWMVFGDSIVEAKLTGPERQASGYRGLGARNRRNRRRYSGTRGGARGGG